MIKKIFFFLSFCIIFNIANASIKENIITNFQKIENLSFNFTQTINEKEEEGECIIKYPKKIYCSYKLKYKKILVSNGKSLVIKSDRNKQYYRYPLKNTPLNFILDKDYLLKTINKLNGKLINEKYYNFSLEENENTINIFFDVKNFNLIGWQTEDIYQNLAVTYIYDLKINSNINERNFILPEMF